jgi:hypothetical protein
MNRVCGVNLVVGHHCPLRIVQQQCLLCSVFHAHLFRLSTLAASLRSLRQMALACRASTLLLRLTYAYEWFRGAGLMALMLWLDGMMMIIGSRVVHISCLRATCAVGWSSSTEQCPYQIRWGAPSKPYASLSAACIAHALQCPRLQQGPPRPVHGDSCGSCGMCVIANTCVCTCTAVLYIRVCTSVVEQMLLNLSLTKPWRQTHGWRAH